jgi:ribosome maturation factor RimP
VEVAASVHDLVAPLVVAEDLELVDVRYTGSQLQVFVDRSGGIDLDTLGRLTTRISRLLDEHDPIPGRYALEVSSPGVERPLRTPEHFARFVGTTISVKTKPHVAGERRERGTLDAADRDGIVITPSEGPGKGVPRRLPYVAIERARTVFEWDSAPKPPAPKRRSSAGSGRAARGKHRSVPTGGGGTR